jgi:hypothetical protein
MFFIIDLRLAAGLLCSYRSICYWWELRPQYSRHQGILH